MSEEKEESLKEIENYLKACSENRIHPPTASYSQFDLLMLKALVILIEKVTEIQRASWLIETNTQKY